jgi:hypothetical protein
MKLQIRTNIYYIAASLIMFVFSGILVYLIITSIYYKQVDESLETECLIIKDEIENTDTIPDYSSVFGHQIEVIMFSEPVKPEKIYTNTELFDKKQEKEISYRQLFYSSNRKNGAGYTISILRPLNELEKLVKAIYLITICSFTILLLLLAGSKKGSGLLFSIHLPGSMNLILKNQLRYNLLKPIPVNSAN